MVVRRDMSCESAHTEPMNATPKGNELFTRLPLPEPTAAAVEEGVFGWCADGTLCPNQVEIRAIVEAQVVGLADLAIKIESYARAEKLGRHPTSGHLARTPKTKEAFRRAARAMAHEARMSFIGHLSAYQDAFGREAAEEMQEFVYALAASAIKPAGDKRQLSFF